VGPTVVICA